MLSLQVLEKISNVNKFGFTQRYRTLVGAGIRGVLLIRYQC